MMATHTVTRGIWQKIEPRPTWVHGMSTRIEIAVGSEPALLDHGVELEQAAVTEIPEGAGDLWCRIHPSSAYSTGEVRTLD